MNPNDSCQVKQIQAEVELVHQNKFYILLRFCYICWPGQRFNLGAIVITHFIFLVLSSLFLALWFLPTSRLAMTVKSTVTYFDLNLEICEGKKLGQGGTRISVVNSKLCCVTNLCCKFCCVKFL